MTPLLGCIADDFTGATDLSTNLVESGMRTIQWFGSDIAPEMARDVDAVVLALKTRSIPADLAVRQSLDGLAALRSLGCKRFFFKYCSTFDSTSDGNIGPVASALLAALGAKQTIFCPSFPKNGRTVYQGHLFVGESLLSESGMQHHPLNPMTDSNLVRILSRQTPLRVGLVPYGIVDEGPEAIRTHLGRLESSAVPLVIADAVDDEQLEKLAAACTDRVLLTGGSGLGKALPAAYRSAGLLPASFAKAELPRIPGRTAILCGSCSPATLEQVEQSKSRCRSLRLDVERCLREGDSLVDQIISWAADDDSLRPLLIFSTSAAHEVAALQVRHGREALAAAIERCFAEIADHLVHDLHFTRLIVAGGETAGAVVSRLGIKALRIGPPIAPGVPWTQAIARQPLALALKSGNFGDPDFFQKAVGMLP